MVRVSFEERKGLTSWRSGPLESVQIMALALMGARSRLIAGGSKFFGQVFAAVR